MNRKKTIFISILVIVALCVAAWFYGHYNHKSNDNLPPLKSIVTMDEGDANALLTGYHTEQLMEVWGEPNKATTNELVWQVGDSVLVVSANNKGKVVVCSLSKAEQNAAAPNKCLDEVAGNITFYEEPVKEAQNSGGTVTVRLSRDLNEEQADKLKDIIDDVDEWVDDHSVDRLAYYFDGNFELSDREHSYYFTYEYNVIYYDHYYAEISAEDMQYIKDLGAECVELPDEIVQDQVSVDGDFGFAFKLVEGTFARGERICLSVVLTNQQNESYVWTGPQSHYRARVKLVNNNGLMNIRFLPNLSQIQMTWEITKCHPMKLAHLSIISVFHPMQCLERIV